MNNNNLIIAQITPQLTIGIPSQDIIAIVPDAKVSITPSPFDYITGVFNWYGEIIITVELYNYLNSANDSYQRNFVTGQTQLILDSKDHNQKYSIAIEQVLANIANVTNYYNVPKNLGTTTANIVQSLYIWHNKNNSSILVLDVAKLIHLITDNCQLQHENTI